MFKTILKNSIFDGTGSILLFLPMIYIMACLYIETDACVGVAETVNFLRRMISCAGSVYKCVFFSSHLCTCELDDRAR